MLGPLTSAEVASAAGLPYISLAKYIERGIVAPSVRLGSGSGSAHEWAFQDLVAIASFGALRPSPSSLDTLKALYTAWHEAAAERIVAAAIVAAAGRTGPPPTTFVLVADDGRVAIETETDLAVLSKKYGPRMYLVDAIALAESMHNEATMRRMTPEAFGDGKKKGDKKLGRKKRQKYPALLREAEQKYGKKKPVKKNTRGSR